MSSCQKCENFRSKTPLRRLFKDLERSSFDGCEDCGILFRAIEHALQKWCASQDVEQDVIEVQWQSSSAKKLFIANVLQHQPESPNEPLLNLQLHSTLNEHSSISAIGAAGMVIADSSTEACIDKIKAWLHTCNTEHRKCNGIKSEWSQRVPIPAKRVIDVGDDQTPPRLLEGKVVRGYYACLSHCWGQASLLTTTKATLVERRAGLALNTLPKTFCDAIVLTRALGLKYIWIDSLCICQDDPVEWKHEASRMFEIYGHAYITLAATAAHDSTEGLFSIRETSIPVSGTNVYVRKKLDHSVFRQAVLSIQDRSQATKYPLFTRGWCLQERLLANRILHFTATELVWQCRSTDMCECDGIKSLDRTNPSRLLTSRLKYNRVIEGSSGTDIWTIWREIIEDYCSTNLTKDSDHLPALSGVAAKFGLAGAGTYIAGLWHKPGALSLGSSPLFLDLLWKSSDANGRRPDVRVAPSFSWASRMGPIQYSNEARDGPTMRYQNDRDGKRKYINKCIFVMQLSHGYEVLDRYAEAPRSVIHARAQLIPCVATLSEDGQRCVVTIDTHEHEFTPDVLATVKEELDGGIVVMPVAAYEHYSTSVKIFDGLVLAQVEANRYRRVGLIEGLPDELLEVTGHEEVVLV